MNGRSLFKKANKFINLLVSFIRFIPYPIRINLLFSLRNVGGKFGISLRYLFIKTICFECGDNVVIYSNVFINSPKNLSLGSNISIHPMCYIDATGGVSIGDNVSIAHSSTILSTTHTYSDFSSPIKYNNIKETYTVINNDVWIG